MYKRAVPLGFLIGIEIHILFDAVNHIVADIFGLIPAETRTVPFTIMVPGMMGSVSHGFVGKRFIDCEHSHGRHDDRGDQ